MWSNFDMVSSSDNYKIEGALQWVVDDNRNDTQIVNNFLCSLPTEKGKSPDSDKVIYYFIVIQ